MTEALRAQLKESLLEKQLCSDGDGINGSGDAKKAGGALSIDITSPPTATNGEGGTPVNSSRKNVSFMVQTNNKFEEFPDLVFYKYW